MKRVYLDNHTAARPSLDVVKQMIPYLRDHFANITSPYILGQEQLGKVGDALNSLYHLIGAMEKDTILFCSSGAEAINHILFSTYLDFTRRNGKNHFVTSLIEEAPTIMGMSRLDSLGIVTKLCEIDHCGRMTKDKLLQVISPRTAILSLSLANGLTGVIQPIEDIKEVCRERSILLHLDVTYALGKLEVDVDELGADFITFDGDALHAPRGSGALYIRMPSYLSPLIVGGNEQGGRRGGSINVANMVGLSVAAEELIDNRDLLCTEIARLRDQFEERLMEALPDCIIFFQDQPRLPNCTVVAFPGVFNEALLYLLSRRGVYATIGGGHIQSLLIVLKACGIEEALCSSAISFALSRETTEEEIDLALDVIVDAVHQLVTLSKGLS